jgi:hypothetical protein
MWRDPRTQASLAADRAIDLRRAADLDRRLRRASEAADDLPKAVMETKRRPLITRLVSAVSRS